jgi:hypothetical protein
MSETARQYIQRITAHVEGRQPLDVQAATSAKLERLISGVPARTLCERPAVDRWSVSEILAHLGDAEIVIAFRLRVILGAPGSPIAAYDQDSWVTSGHYDKRDPHKSVELFSVVRDANLALLESLTPGQWQQYGMHSERGLETIDHYLSDAMAPRRFSLSLMAAFAMVALALAVTGIYAVVAYSVSQRAREIGIRIALGASRSNIARLVMGHGIRFIVLGLVVGLAIAVGATQLLSAMLFGLTATDARTFAQVAMLVAAVSLLACAVPAARVGAHADRS